MRIFISGNEDVCRWHLPVAQAKALSFVERCEKAGLTQNTFHFRFEETGATMQAQYAFGQLSLQMHAPFIPVEEELVEEKEVEFEPKTFFINTTQGYFWVEVRYNEDWLPVVILTQFEALDEDEFIYPGMGMQSFGMLTGCIGGIPSQRYVLTQSGGVMLGEGEEKGTIKLPGTGTGNARITVSQNDIVAGFFCVLENDGGKVAQVKVISVDLLADELVVEMQHGVIDLLVEAEAGNVTSANFPKTPTYIHRKCTGSYFSPNKTIGYHVDVGSDDEYHGNTFIIPPGAQNKLDNGADGELYFNHSQDLYGVASLFAAPIEFNKTNVSLVMVSPTLVWEVTSHDDLCWGGWGQSATYAGCIDLRNDFTKNILSPRPCLVNFSLDSMLVTAFDLPSVEVNLDSWCGTFKANVSILTNIQCGPKHYYEKVEEDNITEPCSWNEDGTGICDSVNGGTFEIQYAVEQRYLQHWVKNFRENITVKRRVEFKFGGRSLLSSSEHRHINPYFLFDGLWHIDFGVMYLSIQNRSNSCSLCSTPPFYQDPGDLVYFKYFGGANQDWILNTGHEYVHNLEVVAPLGIHIMADSSMDGVGEYLGFIARVPEEFDAPHEPVVLTGGVSYPSEEIEGEIVNCEYSLMSAPCICDTPLVWGVNSPGLALDSTVIMYISGGCPPFSWTGNSVSFVNSDGTTVDHNDLKNLKTVRVKSTSECYGSVDVYDVCGGHVSLVEDVPIVSGSITGPSTVFAGESGVYYHNLGPDAVYEGTMPGYTFTGESGNGFVGNVPNDASYGDAYSVIFTAYCASPAAMTVTAMTHCDETVPNTGYSSEPPIGMRVRLTGTTPPHYCGIVGDLVYVETMSFNPYNCPSDTLWNVVGLGGGAYEVWHTRWEYREPFGYACYRCRYSITNED